MTTVTNMYFPGLEGVIAAETRLSRVDGEAGELLLAGYRVEEIAPAITFEEVLYLLWYDRLPAPAELAEFRHDLARRRALPAATVALLRRAAAARVAPMDALRMAAATLDLDGVPDGDEAQARLLAARLPSAVGTYWRLLRGEKPVAPRPDLGHAANFLYMVRGAAPSEAEARALETYFNTVVDHGLNASTFTARVIVSTRSDFTSAIAGAIGALKGPLHGGAPGPALDTVLAIGSAERAEPYLRELLERGERLMGFGHRVYKVRDPRAEVLSSASEALYEADGDMALYRLARHVEETAVRLLAEYKPGRRLQTNVEFYTALLLHGLGLDSALFTPTFAVGRVGGWLGHCLEQRATGRLLRPKARYVGRPRTDNRR